MFAVDRAVFAPEVADWVAVLVEQCEVFLCFSGIMEAQGVIRSAFLGGES
jgi:hypothetical protein